MATVSLLIAEGGGASVSVVYDDKTLAIIALRGSRDTRTRRDLPKVDARENGTRSPIMQADVVDAKDEAVNGWSLERDEDGRLRLPFELNFSVPA